MRIPILSRFEMEMKAMHVKDQIRKTVEQIAERLQECVDALGNHTDRSRLVREPVPVRANVRFPVSRKSARY